MVEFNLSEKIVVEQFHTKEDVDELAYLEIEDVKEFIRLLKEDLMIKQEEPTQMVDEFNKEMFDNIDKLVGDELSK